MKQMGTRRKGRECTLQLLYQHQLKVDDSIYIPDNFWVEQEASPESREFAQKLFDGVVNHIAELDSLINEHSDHWRIDRMSVVDKNILRLAAYELRYCEDIPRKVTLNEAVEIAKRFGTTESGAFVNGILDNLVNKVESLESKVERKESD